MPEPGGRRELNTLVGRVMSQHLDRARPLWEIWAVEGLEDGRWAFISKVHHCMVDGVAATDLMSVIFELDPEPAPVEHRPWQPDPEPGLLDVARSSVAGALGPLTGSRRLGSALAAPRRTVGHGTDLLRAAVPFLKLAKPSAPQRGRQVSLRWVYLH